MEKIAHGTLMGRFVGGHINVKIDFRERKIIRDQEVHYIIIKGSIYQEGITILNMHVPNNRTSKYMK